MVHVGSFNRRALWASLLLRALSSSAREPT